MCIEREKDNFKSRKVNCLKECALALSQEFQSEFCTELSKNVHLINEILMFWGNM